MLVNPDNRQLATSPADRLKLLSLLIVCWLLLEDKVQVAHQNENYLQGKSTFAIYSIFHPPTTATAL